MLLTGFWQSRPTGSESRSTDFAWKNSLLFFSVAGRPLRSTAGSVSALGFSGSTDPVDRSELQSSRVFWVDRPGRPCVDFCPKSAYLIHCFSHLSHSKTGDPSFPFSPKISNSQNLSNFFKILVWFTHCGLDLHSQGFLSNRFQGFPVLGFGIPIFR